MDQLDATLTSVVWSSPESEVFIGRVRTEDGVGIAVLGPTHAPHPIKHNVPYRWHGTWQQHPQHGKQFHFATATPLTHTRRGVIQYLTTIAPHVGQKRAGQLWDVFADAAVETLRTNPEAVVIHGILTQDQAQQASQCLHDEAAWESVRIDLMGILGNRGFQLNRILPLIIQRWRRNAPDVVRRNPYALLLAQFPSCGWKRTDALYLSLGHRHDALKRQALTVLHYLLDRSTGDTWVPATDAAQDLRRKIPTADPVRAMRLAERARLVAIRREANGGKGRWLAPRQWADAEATITRKITELLAWMPSEKRTETPTGSSALLPGLSPTGASEAIW